jgi:hypothetical protein
MCRTASWTIEGWRPFSDLEHDVGQRAADMAAAEDRALSPEIEASGMHGVPFS